MPARLGNLDRRFCVVNAPVANNGDIQLFTVEHLLQIEIPAGHVKIITKSCQGFD